MSSHTTAPNGPSRPWLQALLIAVQTTGAVIVIWNGAPIYRQIVTDASSHQPQEATLVWAGAAVVAMQTCYWWRLRLHPALPRWDSSLCSHIVLFLGRLSFILAAATFSVVFFMRPEGLHLPFSRLALLVAVLFSMFCYTLELERLGKALQGPEGKP